MVAMKWIRVAVSGFGLMLAGTAQAAYIEMLSPASVEAGSPVAVEVWAKGLTDEFIGSYDLTILHDPLLVGFQSAEFGIGLDGPADSLQDVLLGVGSVNLAEVSLSGLFNQDGVTDFRLFTLNFATLAVGQVAFTFDGVLLSDALGGELTASDLIGTNLTVTTPSPVPLPGALGLFAMGFAGIGLSRRKSAAR